MWLYTKSEREELSNRRNILKMLEKGVPHRKIAEILGVGIATVTRGSNALKAQKIKREPYRIVDGILYHLTPANGK